MLQKFREDKVVFLNTAYQIVGKIVTAGLGVISMAYLARHLGVHDFGEYNLVFAFLGTAFLLADFGLNTLLIRTVAQEPDNTRIQTQVFSLRLILSSIVVGVLLFFNSYIPYSEQVQRGILIAGLGYAFFLQAAVMWGVFQSRLTFEKAVVSQVAGTVVQFVMIVAGVYFNMSFAYFMWAFIAGNVMSFFVSWILFKPSFRLISFRGAHLTSVLRASLPFAAGVIVSTLYFRFDMLYLGYIFEPSQLPDVGLYALAYKPFEVVLLLGGYYSQVLFPLFSSLLKKKKPMKYVNRYLAYSAIIGISAMVSLYIFAPIVIALLGGETYNPAITPMQILSLAVAPSIMSGFFLTIAIAGKKEIQALYIAIIALVINVVLNVLFVPTYSYIAASWITVVTQTCIMAGYLYISLSVVRGRRG